MRRNLIYIQIALWSVIVIFGLGMLGYSIANEMNLSSGEPVSSQLMNQEDHIEENVQESFDITSDGIERIKVDLTDEDIQICMGETDFIEVWHYANRELPESERLQVDALSNTLSIKKNTQLKFLKLFNFIEEKIVITIPENYSSQLDIEVVSGDIIIEGGGYSQVDLSTVSGNQELRELQADTLNQYVISGNIRDESIECNRIELDSVSGNIESYFTQMPYKLEAGTVSGDIDLRLPENDGFEINYETVSGDLRTDFDIEWKNKDKREGRGIYKKENSSLEIETISGDIQLKR